MSQQLDKVKLVKGPKGWLERMDPLDNIGVSTYNLLRDAIQEGRNQLAKDLTDYLFVPENKLLHDIIYEMIWGWPSFVQKNYGEDAVYRAMKQSMVRGWAQPWFFVEPTIAKRNRKAVDRLIWGYGLRTWRGHRMGAYDGLRGFKVEEYEDRLVIVWDPCSSGCRMRRGDEITGAPSKMGPPYNLGVTQVPHPWSWSKTGVGLYCIHCCIVHEQMEVEQFGYLNWLVDSPEIGNEICRWTCYEDEDAIPAEYYTRIGKAKPKPKKRIAKPKDPNKILRVRNSEEYLEYPYITVKKAIDTGNKAETLKAVDEIQATNKGLHRARWNWAWMDYVVDRYGYDELYHGLRTVNYSYEPPPAPGTPKPTKATIPSAEERVREATLWGRSDGSGPNMEGSVNIIDEGDKIVMEMNPCGSVGRQKTGDPAMGVPRATDPPYSLGVTRIAHPVAWGKVGIPHFCAFCCVHKEMGSIVRTGYLTTIIEVPEDPNDGSCRWLFYRDMDAIPEKYYTRIGAKKPPRQP